MGLAVETMAPMALAARKHMGKWMLLGVRRRTTSFFVMPRWRKPRASLATWILSWAKESVWEELASMRAGLVWKEETLEKRNETKERLGSLGSTGEGLRDLYIPS
ncbi:hypothetical protein SESBI_42853 [Sesbania bispinosa]|nr:hypothetical protein SESBI_42853 [Sesbania bispinosa]